MGFDYIIPGNIVNSGGSPGETIVKGTFELVPLIKSPIPVLSGSDDRTAGGQENGMARAKDSGGGEPRQEKFKSSGLDIYGSDRGILTRNIYNPTMAANVAKKGPLPIPVDPAGQQQPAPNNAVKPGIG